MDSRDFKSIFSDGTLSDKSVEGYARCIKGILIAAKTSDARIMYKDPLSVLDVIAKCQSTDTKASPSFEKQRASACLRVLKFYQKSDLSSSTQKAIDMAKGLFRERIQSCAVQVSSVEPNDTTDREAKKDLLTWPEILETVEILRKKLSQQDLTKLSLERAMLPEAYILLFLYTIVPPARADYVPLRWYTSMSQAMAQKENGLVDDELVSSNVVVALFEYKTSKYMRDSFVEVDEENSVRLRAFFNHFGVMQKNQATGVEKLFVIKPRPKTDGSSTTGKILRRAWQIAGKKCDMTVNDIRHEFVSAHINENTPSNQRIKIAKGMCHSLAMQLKYTKLDRSAIYQKLGKPF